jgi:hypothetical protein
MQQRAANLLLSLGAAATLALSGPAFADNSNVRLPPLDNGEPCCLSTGLWLFVEH